MFSAFTNLLRSNSLSLTSNVKNLHSFLTTKNIVSTFLSAKTPIIQQTANRVNIFYIPDWNLPLKRSGPRGKHYKPNVMKRIATHGLEERLKTRGGKQILWRKILKGPKGWITLVPAP